MYNIRHAITINANAETVHHALATVPGLKGWWTETTSGSCSPGEQIDFRFGEHKTTMKVKADQSGTLVSWECLDSTPDWTGTQLRFDLTRKEDTTILRFEHSDWRDNGDFYAHCSMKWATFLLSLKAFVETGEGRPFPNDIPI